MEVGEEGGKEIWVGGGGGEIIYLSLHCHHQNDSCMKMGSDESHFNVSVGNDGESHRTVPTNHNLFEEKGEPKRYRAEVLPLPWTAARTTGCEGSVRPALRSDHRTAQLLSQLLCRTVTKTVSVAPPLGICHSLQRYY